MGEESMQNKKVDIIEIIKMGLNTQLESILAGNPAISEGKTEQGVSFLLFAAYCRNNRAVELLKKYKQQLDIYEAASTGELTVTKRLIEMHPDTVNKPSNDGFSPLGLSCFFGHFEIAEYLIEKGADVNLVSNNSFRVAPLHSACAISDFAIAELLLKSGANPNTTQQNEITPLHEAAHSGKTELVKLLIEYNANVNAKMDSGQTPFSMAVEKGYTETADFIRKEINQKPAL